MVEITGSEGTLDVVEGCRDGRQVDLSGKHAGKGGFLIMQCMGKGDARRGGRETSFRLWNGDPDVHQEKARWYHTD